MLSHHEVSTPLVPSPVAYATLAPPDAGDGLPLLLWLHGGGDDEGWLETCRPVFEAAWRSGALPPMVVATPSAARSAYLDRRDGAERWETFVLEDLLDSVRASTGCSTAAADTYIGGVSMGGMGALRMAFRHPERFGAVLALEPAIEAAARWSEVELRDLVYREPDRMETWFGAPGSGVDPEFWEANHPTALLVDNAVAIVAAGLSIYLDVGDLDFLHIDRGVERLHREMDDRAVPHEYRLVRGGDHIGASVPARIGEALAFLGRQMEPPGPDPDVEAFRPIVAAMETSRGYRRSVSVAVAGGTIDVTVLGGDPTTSTLVVLIPSLGRPASDFEDLAARLAHRGYVVAMPEPRGIGATTAPLDHLSMQILADDVAAVIREVGGASSAVVAGHAFGNRVARMAATEHPELVDGVILLACGGSVAPDADDLAALLRVFDESLDDDEHLAAVARAFFADGNDPRVWRDGWFASVAQQQSAAVEAQPASHWLAAGNAPVLVVQPAEDRIAVPANAAAVAEAIGDRATVVTVPRAGHGLLPEQPAAVATAVLSWLCRPRRPG